MKSLEKDILGQSSESTHNSSSFIVFVARDKILLKSLLGEQGKTALVRTRFAQLNDMDAPTVFFFGLEKKSREQKIFPEIQAYALSFYEDSYCSKECDGAAAD